MITPKGTDILTGFFERGKYFKTTLKGSYENSAKAWEKAYTEIADIMDYSIIEDGEPFEVYVNNIMTTTNPADLITEIYIPVEKVRIVEDY
jgi:predicted transcriptional regulator YdeE